MVADSELVERLREFLRASDLSTTTTTIVRRKLEEDFGVDLSDKKAFIREQVDLFLSELTDNKEAEDEDGSGGDEGDQDGEEGSGEKVDQKEEEDDEDEDGDDEDERRSNGGGSSKKRR